jgi:hypothetical protein
MNSVASYACLFFLSGTYLHIRFALNICKDVKSFNLKLDEYLGDESRTRQYTVDRSCLSFSVHFMALQPTVLMELLNILS